VSKYTDPATRSNEDGTIANDLSGVWSFINSSKVTKVPFDKGYYAEFKVKDFSEFWLNNGDLSGLIPLPVKILSFDAQKQPGGDVILKWKVADESNIDRYEIQVARSSKDYQLNNFIKIGQVTSIGNSSITQNYNFTDAEDDKTGVRYYRLKIIELDGSFYYSEIRPVIFNNEITWHVYPNPSNGLFNFIFQQSRGETIHLSIYNTKGQLVEQIQTPASGFVQKIIIDLREAKFTPGMYMIVAEGAGTRTFKVIKQ
jgi:hypothetical protein